MLHTTFPVLGVSEIRTLTFPFLGGLAVGVTISTPTVTVSVYSGTDATPSALKSGSASVSGTDVLQKVTGAGGVLGVVYSILATVTTSDGQTLSCQGYLALTPDAP